MSMTVCFYLPALALQITFSGFLPELKIPSQIRANAGLMGGASLINKDI